MSELMDRFSSYGGDVDGVMDRFMGDEELFIGCLAQFAQSDELDTLEECVMREAYEEAFEAAHALKGVTGNLGLTPLFDKVCVLVEALRAHDYSNVKEQLNDVLDGRKEFVAVYEEMTK